MKNSMQIPYIPPNVDFPDDATEQLQGNASWAADYTEAVLKEEVVGGGLREEICRWTTNKKKNNYFIIK